MPIQFFWNADMPQFRPNRRGHSLFLDHPCDTRVIWACQELVVRSQGLCWEFEFEDNYLKIQKILWWNSKKIAPICTFGSNMRIWPRKTPACLLLQHVAVSAGNVMNRTLRHLSCVCFWGSGTYRNFGIKIWEFIQFFSRIREFIRFFRVVYSLFRVAYALF